MCVALYGFHPVLNHFPCILCTGRSSHFMSSKEELLALLISRKLITDASAGSLFAANLPGRARLEAAFSFRWKNINPTDQLTFKIVTSALLQGSMRVTSTDHRKSNLSLISVFCRPDPR